MHFTARQRQVCAGQSVAEYAIIIVLAAILLITALTLMGPLVGSIFFTVNTML